MSQSLSHETALPVQLIALECSRGRGSPSSRCQWVLVMHLPWTSVLCPVRALRQMVPVRGGHTINATFATAIAQMEPACCGVAGKLALGLESEPDVKLPPPVCWVPLKPHSFRAAPHRQAGAGYYLGCPFSKKTGSLSPTPFQQWESL